MPARLDPLGRSPHLVRLRQRALDDQLPQSLLVLGPEGSGKEALAIELARALLCEGTDRPCGGQLCSPCRKVTQLAHADLLYSFPTESSLSLDGYRDLLAAKADEPLRRVPQAGSAIISIGDSNDPFPTSVRAIRRFVGVKPFEGRRRVVIVGDAHRMNRAAANALLKTLEEPPAASLLLLCSHQPHLLPSTVRSRCGRIQVPPLAESELAAHLTAKHGLSAREASTIAAASGGNARRALDLLDPVARQIADWSATLLGWIVEGDTASLLRGADKVAKGQDPSGGKGKKIADAGLTASRDVAMRVVDFLVSDLLLLERLGDGAQVEEIQRERLDAAARRMPHDVASRMASVLMDARQDLARNVNVSLVLHHAFLQLESVRAAAGRA